VGSSPLATGSDIGGSIRIPAASCGVVGFKPPYGRNPDNTMFAFDMYAVMGPMSRTIEDAAVMQNILCGPHPLDNASIRPKYVLPTRYEGIEGLKIAWSMDLGFFEVDAQVRTNTLRTLSVLKDLGAELVEVDFGWSPEADRAAQNYLDHLFNGYIKRFVDTDPGLATPWATYCANASGKTDAAEFTAAYEVQAKMSHHVGAIMDDCYAFVCPTLNYHEIPADQHPEDAVVINGKTVDPLYGWCMCHPFNMLGRIPVLAVPSGLGENGLPTGIQIAARHLDDERVFRIATALEAAQPWLDCSERRLDYPQGIQLVPKIPLRVKKNTMAIIAPAGRVMSQDAKISRTTLRSTAARPLVMPTPMTAPTAMWVVDTGKPVLEASTTVEAAASVAQ
jgi:amidase